MAMVKVPPKMWSQPQGMEKIATAAAIILRMTQIGKLAGCTRLAPIDLQPTQKNHEEDVG